jgi:hypothetical protein
VAIPVVVPLVVMKVTGRSGRQWSTLADAIEAPPNVVVTPNEEVSKEEVKEAFLKITDQTVRFFSRGAAGMWSSCAAGGTRRELVQGGASPVASVSTCCCMRWLSAGF